MKGRHLKIVLDTYAVQSHTAPFPVLRHPPAMQRIKAIFEDTTKADQDVTSKAKALIAQHWGEIKNTDRSYTKLKLKATEKAYVKLGELVDAVEEKSVPDLESLAKTHSFYVRIKTLMPTEEVKTPFNTRINFSGEQLDHYKDEGFFQFRPWVHEMKLEGTKDQKKVIECLRRRYDPTTLRNLQVALSNVKPSRFAPAEELELMKSSIERMDVYMVVRDVWGDDWDKTEEKKSGSENEESVLKNIFFHLVKNHNKAELKKLEESLDKATDIPQAKRELITKAIKKHIKDYDHYKALHTCENPKCGNVLLIDIPERYFFKTRDNIGLDIRILFLTGFINPTTGQPIEAEDVEKLKAHVRLGFSVMVFHGMKDIFHVAEEKAQVTTASYGSTGGSALASLSAIGGGVSPRETKEKEEKSVDLCSLEWTKKPLANRQKVYAQVFNLRELFKHIDLAFIRNAQCAYIASVYQAKFDAFAYHLETINKSNLIWSEMDDKTFFEQAAPVVETVKEEMKSDWDEQAKNVFMVMRDFALDTENLIRKAGSYSVSLHGEYLARDVGLNTTDELRAGMKILVQQYKASWDIAYRYQKLPLLMTSVLGYHICVAEKMKGSAGVFAMIGSAPLVNGADLGDSPDPEIEVFTKIFRAARDEEGRRGRIWQAQDFLDYITPLHVGKTKYTDKEGNIHTIDKELVKYYIELYGFEFPKTVSAKM